MRQLRSIKSLLLMVTLLLTMGPAQIVNANAAAVTGSAQIIPLEIIPNCSNANTMEARWNVTNKNDQTVNVHWTNLYTNVEGNFLAPSGSSGMLTNYNAADANNTTRFASGSDINQTNATQAACQQTPEEPIPAEQPAECINGSIQQNLEVNFVSKNVVNITSKDNKALCNDVDVYFSSYIMPADYNGQGFYDNPTAYPQPIFSSDHVTLLKDVPASAVMQIELPADCNNIQTDVYYAPEIREVGPNGHGTQNILSGVYRSNGPCETAGNTDNEEEVVPPAPTAPVAPDTQPTVPTAPVAPSVMTKSPQITTAQAPAAALPLPDSLPNVGSNLLATVMTMFVFATVVGYVGALEYQKRRYA